MESLRIVQKRRCTGQKPPVKTETVLTEVQVPINYTLDDISNYSINDIPQTDKLISITGGPSTYTFTIPSFQLIIKGFFTVRTSLVYRDSITLSIVLPAINDTAITAISSNITNDLFFAFTEVSPGVYGFATAAFFLGQVTYTAGQTLSCFLSNGLQTFSLDGVLIGSTHQEIDTSSGWQFDVISGSPNGNEVTIPHTWTLSLSYPIQAYVTRIVGQFGTCIKKLSDRPNVIESQRIIRERCPEILVNGLSRTVPIGQPSVYIPVETKDASQTTSALKDAITAVEPRFYEFIKPRPLPPDFLQVPRQVSNAGEPLAKNTACALGEIKRVL